MGEDERKDEWSEARDHPPIVAGAARRVDCYNYAVSLPARRHAFVRCRIRSRQARADQRGRPGSRELINRFDFKGIDAKFQLDDVVIAMSAPQRFPAEQVLAHPACSA